MIRAHDAEVNAM